MSLLQLLTTGKALEGAHNSPQRYRMTNQRLLPKFGTKRNPFAASESVVPAAISQEAKPPAPPVEITAPSPKTVSSQLAPTRGIVGLAQWLKRVKLPRFRWTWKRSPVTARPPAAERRPPATQGELRLEGIQVVRNDLGETDLEIVTQRREEVKADCRKQTTEVFGAAADEGQCGISEMQAGAPSKGYSGAMQGAWKKVRSRLVGSCRN